MRVCVCVARYWCASASTAFYWFIRVLFRHVRARYRMRMNFLGGARRVLMLVWWCENDWERKWCANYEHHTGTAVQSFAAAMSLNWQTRQCARLHVEWHVRRRKWGVNRLSIERKRTEDAQQGCALGYTVCKYSDETHGLIIYHQHKQINGTQSYAFTITKVRCW